MNTMVMSQLTIFAWAVFFGVIMGLVYDLFRIIRRIVPHNKIIVSLEDIVFWLTSSFLVFEYIFKANSGTLRGFIFIGLCMGIVLYLLTLSQLIVSNMSKFLRQCIEIIKQITFFLLKPLIFVTKPIRKFINFNAKGLKKSKKCLIMRLRIIHKEIKYMIHKI